MQCAYNVTLKSIRVIIDAVEEQCIIFSECVRSLNYPICRVHEPHYIVTFDLSDSTKFFHIIS